MIYFVCGGGGEGGEYHSQVRKKKAKYLDFSEDCMFWSHACEHVFAVCHKLKLSVLLMLL